MYWLNVVDDNTQSKNIKNERSNSNKYQQNEKIIKEKRQEGTRSTVEENTKKFNGKHIITVFYFMILRVLTSLCIR